MYIVTELWIHIQEDILASPNHALNDRRLLGPDLLKCQIC